MTKDIKNLVKKQPRPVKPLNSQLWGGAPAGGIRQGEVDTASQDSVQRMADIINHLPDATIVIDKEHRVIAWNRAMEELTGVKAADMLGKGNYEHALPFYSFRRPILADLVVEPNEKMETHYYKIQRDREVYIVETPALFVNGKMVYLWGKATVLYNSQGEVVGAIESIRDITKRKQMEEDLLLLSKAVENTGNAVMMTDRKGLRPFYLNQAFVELFGYTKEQLELEGVPTLFLNSDTALTVYGSLKNGESWRGEFELRSSDNRIVPVYFHGDMVKDETGKPIGLFGVFTDITERKKAEAALRESEQRLADMINFLPDATFVLDNEHKVIAWNRAMEEMTGVKAEDVLGKGDYEYAIPFYGYKRPLLADVKLEPNEEMEKDYILIEKSKEVYMVETPALQVRGKETYLWGKATLLYDTHGEVVGAIQSIRDLTERKRVEKEKLEAQERAARSERLASLGIMSAGIAHEINQPLNSLKVSIDSILYWNKLGKQMEWGELIEELQQISEQASRIDSIIKRMRSYIRNQQYSELTPCSLNMAVDRALDLLRVQLSTHGIKVRKRLGKLPLVLGSPQRLQEIIINLLVNAIQSLDSIERKEKKIVCTTRFENRIILEISDNGVGLNEELKNKIFEPFFTTKLGEGMGLGLFIVQNIVTSLNGEIHCSPNKSGTTFRVELPTFN